MEAISHRQITFLGLIQNTIGQVSLDLMKRYAKFIGYSIFDLSFGPYFHKPLLSSYCFYL